MSTAVAPAPLHPQAAAIPVGHPVRSMASKLMDLSPEDRAAWLESLTSEEADALLHSWNFWARPYVPPP
jgi:hypothetical protein